MLSGRSISGYVGVGNFSEGTIESMPSQLTPADAKAILKSTFIVQEYIPGGTLKDLVIDAVCFPLSCSPIYRQFSKPGPL